MGAACAEGTELPPPAHGAFPLRKIPFLWVPGVEPSGNSGPQPEGAFGAVFEELEALGSRAWRSGRSPLCQHSVGLVSAWLGSRRGSGNVFLAHPVLPGALRRWLRRAGCARPVSLRVRFHPSGNGAGDPRPLRSCAERGALTQPRNSCGKSRSCFIGCSVGREEPRGDGAWPRVVPPAPGILGGCRHPGRLPHP